MDTPKEGWHYVGGTKAAHWLHLYWFDAGHPWAKADVKWDGCIDLTTVSNEPYTINKPANESQCEDYIHICNIDRQIERLKQLKLTAQGHFGNQWP